MGPSNEGPSTSQGRACPGSAVAKHTIRLRGASSSSMHWAVAVLVTMVAASSCLVVQAAQPDFCSMAYAPGTVCVPAPGSKMQAELEQAGFTEFRTTMIATSNNGTTQQVDSVISSNGMTCRLQAVGTDAGTHICINNVDVVKDVAAVLKNCTMDCGVFKMQCPDGATPSISNAETVTNTYSAGPQDGQFYTNTSEGSSLLCGIKGAEPAARMIPPALRLPTSPSCPAPEADGYITYSGLPFCSKPPVVKAGTSVVWNSSLPAGDLCNTPSRLRHVAPCALDSLGSFVGSHTASEMQTAVSWSFKVDPDAGSALNVTLSTCGLTSASTVLTVREGCDPASGKVVKCSGEPCSLGFAQTTLTFSASPGATYTVYLQLVDSRFSHTMNLDGKETPDCWLQPAIALCAAKAEATSVPVPPAPTSTATSVTSPTTAKPPQPPADANKQGPDAGSTQAAKPAAVPQQDQHHSSSGGSTKTRKAVMIVSIVVNIVLVVALLLLLATVVWYRHKWYPSASLPVYEQLPALDPTAELVPLLVSPFESSPGAYQHQAQQQQQQQQQHFGSYTRSQQV